MNIKNKTRKKLTLNVNKVAILDSKKEFTNNIDTKERQQQQKFFNKRKHKELKAEKHQEKVRTDKREKIMKKLNNQAKQDLLKKQAQIQGFYTPTEIDKELMQAFKYNKVNWKKFFLIYFTNPEHSIKKYKIKGLFEFRFKKEEYLSKKKEFLLWIKKHLKKYYQQIIKRFNYTMERYVKKYNNDRFKEYKISL